MSGVQEPQAGTGWPVNAKVARLERELEEEREKYADVVELLNDKAARLVAAEAAAEEARQLIADIWEHPSVARDLIQANGRGDPFAPYDAEIATLRAAAEEARQELAEFKRVYVQAEEEIERNAEAADERIEALEADRAEARQERDAAVQELQNYVTAVPEWAEKDKARIQTLERVAAGKEVENVAYAMRVVARQLRADDIDPVVTVMHEDFGVGEHPVSWVLETFATALDGADSQEEGS